LAGVIDVSGVISAGSAQIKQLAAEQIDATTITVDSLSASKITAGDIKTPATGAITIGGWTVGNNSLTATAYGSIGLYSTFSGTKSIAGSGQKDDWRIVAGDNFGVDKSGNLYCNSGKFQGDITGATGTFTGLIGANNSLISVGYFNNLFFQELFFYGFPDARIYLEGYVDGATSGSGYMKWRI